MTPRLPTLSASEMQRVLERDGFCVISQKGSHRKLALLSAVPKIRHLSSVIAVGAY